MAETELLDVTTYEDEDIPELFVKLIPPLWGKLLYVYEEEIRAAGIALKGKVRNGHRLVPEPHNIFRAFYMTPWQNVKVVIIGQDPYFSLHGGQAAATGCSFECWEGFPIQRSLENIFMRLWKTIDGFQLPQSGDLTKWMVQGVFMFNAALTTNGNTNVSNAHKDIWEFMPVRVLEFLSKMRSNVVYMLWGRFAQRFAKYIDRSKNLILETSHPSARGNHNTFTKCDHFNQANEYLVQTGQSPIDWRL